MEDVYIEMQHHHNIAIFYATKEQQSPEIHIQ